jgi:hypothetical protein
MSNQYFRRPILADDFPATTTGVSFVAAAPLYFNDFLSPEWLERKGATPFTASTCETLTLVHGFFTDKQPSFDDPVTRTRSQSGVVSSTAIKTPRQTIKISAKSISLEESVQIALFYHRCRGQEIEFVDENGNSFLGEWVGELSMSKNVSQSVSQPYSLSVNFEVNQPTGFTSGTQFSR